MAVVVTAAVGGDTKKNINLMIYKNNNQNSPTIKGKYRGFKDE